MGNSTPNTRRNVISGIVALIVILIILLCLRLCKHDEEDVPTPQATPSASTPQDTIKQGRESGCYRKESRTCCCARNTQRTT